MGLGDLNLKAQQHEALQMLIMCILDALQVPRKDTPRGCNLLGYC